MRKILLALATIAGLFASPAYADFTAKDASAATITFFNTAACTSVVCKPQNQLIDSAGAEILGLVTASPAANTIGDRLKTINTTLGSPLQAGGNIGTVTAITAITNALPAGTNVIGHAIIDTGSTTAVTQATGTNLHAVIDTGSTTAVTQATGTNLHAVIDTGSTTAVTQATGTNLHSVVDSGTITTVSTVTNLAQMNGAALLMGNGTTGTGSQRVTIASDNTAFSVNAASTLAAETTKVIGTVRNLGNGGAITDFAGQNASSPANSWLIGGQFNTTPTTISSGNASPLQLDSAGNLLVNIKTGASSGAVAQGSTTSGQTGLLIQGAVTTASPSYTTAQTSPLSLDTAGSLRVAIISGAGSGGTAIADGGAFTEASTSFTPVGGEYVSGGGANCTTGKGCTWQMTIDRAGYVNNYKWAGGVLGAMANYGTSPGAVLVPGVNAFVTNTNANGSATSANSSPVVIASDQVAVAVKAASGTLASGAVVDITNVSTPIAAATATATKGILLGGQYDSTQKTLTNGQQAGVSLSARGAVMVATGADTFTVGGAGTAGSASGGVLTVQGAASMTKLLVTPDSVALPANQSVNVAQVAGTTTDTNSGNKSAGSQRMVVATDQLALATWGHGATGAAAPSGATQMGVVQSGATGGFMKGQISCDSHVFKHITSATDTLAVQGVASQTIYVCSWRSRAAGVATWYLENTGDTAANCSATKTQITGVATEAANTGETWGSAFWSGLKNTSGNGLCINSTGTGGVDVDIWYTQF